MARIRLWRWAMATAPDVEARASGEGRLRLMRTMRTVLADWLHVDPDMDVRPDAMSAAVLGVTPVAVEHYMESNGEADLVNLVLDAFEFLDRGLRHVAPTRGHGGSATRPKRGRPDCLRDDPHDRLAMRVQLSIAGRDTRWSRETLDEVGGP